MSRTARALPSAWPGSAQLFSSRCLEKTWGMLGMPRRNKGQFMKSVARRLRTGDFGTGMRWAVPALVLFLAGRSGERRVGEKGRSRGAPYHLKKKKEKQEIDVAVKQ